MAKTYRITTNGIGFRIEERLIDPIQPTDSMPAHWIPVQDGLGPYKTFAGATATIKWLRRWEAEADLPWVEVPE